MTVSKISVQRLALLCSGGLLGLGLLLGWGKVLGLFSAALVALLALIVGLPLMLALLSSQDPSADSEAPGLYPASSGHVFSLPQLQRAHDHRLIARVLLILLLALSLQAFASVLLLSSLAKDDWLNHSILLILAFGVGVCLLWPSVEVAYTERQLCRRRQGQELVISPLGIALSIGLLNQVDPTAMLLPEGVPTLFLDWGRIESWEVLPASRSVGWRFSGKFRRRSHPQHLIRIKGCLLPLVMSGDCLTANQHETFLKLLGENLGQRLKRSPSLALAAVSKQEPSLAVRPAPAQLP